MWLDSKKGRDVRKSEKMQDEGIMKGERKGLIKTGSSSGEGR